MEPAVQDVPDSQRYEIRDGGQVLGHAAYRRSEGQVTFTHTVVEAEGAGIGSRLVRAALDDARARGERVVAQCSFVRGWIDRHPDYADLVA